MLRNDMRSVRWGVTILCLTVAVCVNPLVAQAPKTKPATKKADKPPAEAVRADEPGVAAILETKPKTPEECVRAAKTLSDLNRADLAKGFLKKVLEANLDAQQLADLGQQIGLPEFVDMSVRPALLPEARELSDAVAAAVKARREDSKRIADLIGQLQDASAEKRLKALIGLQEAREAAIGPLLAVLADPARKPEFANVRAVLIEMGSVALPALVAVAEGADAHLATQAVEALGNMKDSRVALSLLRPCLSEKSDQALRDAAAAALRRLGMAVPSRTEAVHLLTDAVKAYFERSSRVAGGPDGKVVVWRWDQAKRQCTARTCTADDASRAVAVRRARDAYDLAPDDPSVGVLCAAAILEAAAYENGLDRPLGDKTPAVVEAKQFGVKTLEETLTFAEAKGRFAAAAAATRILGRIGKASELLHQGVRPSPLALAAQSPDRRLRLAALEAIVRLQPAEDFTGAGRVSQALGFFAASSGFRHALVACPFLDEARELAGMLSAAGYQVDTFTTGKELLLKAAQSPDYELALIDMTIDHPVAGLLLQQLRHDPRTASLRVGLIARDGHFEQAERLARLDGLAKAFARPHDDRAFRWQLDQLATLAPDEFVGFAVRQRQAATALDLLTELYRSSSRLYDLRGVQNSIIAAVYNPRLAAKAVSALADVNSAQSQQTLVDVASRFTLPLSVRQAAAKAFRQNTERHGILLTSEEIRRQYQRYNESDKLDVPTQRVLARILDCLEVGVPKKK
jgi:CheY-like chemotaxis protein